MIKEKTYTKKKESNLAKQAKHFTEQQLLHRDVSLILEGVDKFENLFGTIILENNKCFQEELLSKGFATIAEWNVGNSKFTSNMRKAEQEGIKKKGVFKSFKPVESSLTDEDKKTYQGIVVQVISGDSLKNKKFAKWKRRENIFIKHKSSKV